jgi:ribonucleoside-diphosphate reductase alpha chain
MSIAERTDVAVRRHFTTAGVDPYDTVTWEERTARIENWKTGTVAFEQHGVEVPVGWSVNATNILAQKYFRGTIGTPERESSLRQVVDRIVDTITGWGVEGDYLDDVEASVFRDELKWLLIHQYFAFNSPVWFNIGVPGVAQQASACFILDVDDTMDAILNWYREEGIIFKGGSGAGVNLSKIRSSVELLKGGGTASGPVSFMRGADASAGTIKSGGKTRRAAKMVILNVDHPDVEEFISCKAIEERKARVLRDNGFDMDLDGRDSHSIQYQNANNSIRVPDEFMQAVVDDTDWHLRAVADGKIVKTVRARALYRQFAEAAWECADPGMQFDTTINRWNTSSNTGRINGSNPCSEYMHLDNSSCNLASLNLLAFLNGDDSFDHEGFTAAIDCIFTAQEILVGRADYPTEQLARTSIGFRQIGLGYANLGAFLMAQGHAYDSPEGRSLAAVITALMTGHAYRVSAGISRRLGPHAAYLENSEPMLNVLRMHRNAVDQIDTQHLPGELYEATVDAWDDAITTATLYGVRNAQATVLAPTGTIGLLMDCDTTGVEPDLGLVKTKKLVGGGTMTIINQTIPRALRRLGYAEVQVTEIGDYVAANRSIVGAPHLKPQHLPVFACSMGDNTIHYLGHVRMMAAVQPFLSGAISKTVNMPEAATVDDIEQLHLDAWRMGIKAIAVYRDNCKVGQPLSTKATQTPTVVVTEVARPVRERLPRRRRSNTFAFRVSGCEGYVHVGEYDDGRPGEVFINVSKQGSTLAGIMDAFSIAISLGLQHGVPLATFCRKFVHMRFEPAGITDDPDLRIASSLMDYIFRRIALDYLPLDERTDLGILATNERTQQSLPGIDTAVTVNTHVIGTPEAKTVSAPFCYSCGNEMQRAGSCHVCPACGTTSGCS